MTAKIRIASRHARAEAGPLLALTLLVFVTSALAAVVPLHLSATADTAVRQTLAQATDAERELTLSSANDLPVAQLETIHRQVLASMSPAVRTATDEAYRGVSTGQYAARLPDGSLLRDAPASWIRLRGQPGLLDTVTWLQGEAPGGPVGYGRLGGAPRVMFEAAVSRGVAETLGLRVGQTLVLEPVNVSSRPGQQAAIRISGVFTPQEPASPTWQLAPELQNSGEEVVGETIVALTGTLLIPESQMAGLVKVSPLLTYGWHYPVRTDAVDAESAPTVRDGLEQMIARGVDLPQTGDRSVTGGSPSLSISSGLVDILDGYLASRLTAEAVTSVSVVGVLALAFLVVTLGAAGLASRRAAVLGLSRARGVSRWQAAAWSLVESALLVIPATAAGYLVATWAVPARFSPTALALAVLVAGWALASVVVGILRTYGPSRLRRLAGRLRWRPLGEVVVVLLAGAGLAQLQRRGVGSDGVDPVLATVPLLMLAAAVVLALRVLPALLRLAGRLTHRSRGPVGFLGLVGAGRAPAVVVAPISALALGLGFGAFAAGTHGTVDQGQTVAAWETVGADYRIDALSFLGEDVRRLEAIPGVEHVLPALNSPPSQVISADGDYERAGLLAIDASGYGDVLSPAPRGLVDADALRAISRRLSPDDPLPVLATPDAVQALQGRVGEIDPGVALPRTPIRVVGEIESFPVVGSGPVVVADLELLRERHPALLVRPNALLLRGSATAADELRTVAESLPQAARLHVRADNLAEVRDDPFVALTTRVFVGGTLVAAGYCTLAVVLALLLGARARATIRSTLRILGASTRETGRISMLELAPLVLLMVATGLVVGHLLPWAVLPAIGLTAFTGGTNPPEIRGDATTAMLLGAGALLMAGSALVIVNAARRWGGRSAVPSWEDEE